MKTKTIIIGTVALLLVSVSVYAASNKSPLEKINQYLADNEKQILLIDERIKDEQKKHAEAQEVIQAKTLESANITLKIVPLANRVQELLKEIELEKNKQRLSADTASNLRRDKAILKGASIYFGDTEGLAKEAQSQ